MEITTSWEEKGIEQGIERGLRSLLTRLLARRFGTLDVLVLERINALPVTELEALGDALLDFSALADVQAWLDYRTS